MKSFMNAELNAEFSLFLSAELDAERLFALYAELNAERHKTLNDPWIDISVKYPGGESPAVKCSVVK